MADQLNSETLQVVINALLASGFPFQTAVAQVVQRCQGYKLIGEEVAWRDDAGVDQFLDLVAQRGHVILPIECKKTQKEMLTFLRPSPADSDVNRARCVYLSQIQDSTRRSELFCSDWQLMPKSAESAFCVVSTSSSGRDQRMLERDVQQLVRGTDAYAQRYKHNRNVNVASQDALIVPLLVTNAKLFVADYDPANVSLETGKFEMPPPTEVLPTDWVRFRKAFTSAGRDVGDRTVFVVAAPAFPEFLGKLDAISSIPSQDGKIHIP
jgi:hypothetical protein